MTVCEREKRRGGRDGGRGKRKRVERERVTYQTSVHSSILQ